MITRTQSTRPTLRSFLFAFVLAGVLAAAGAVFAQNQEQDSATLLASGDSAIARGNCALAQFYYQEVLKTEAENVPALIGQGRSLACQGAYDGAVEAYLGVLELEPDNLRAHIQLALTYQNQYQSDPNRFVGRLDEALRVIGEAERIAPADPRVLNTKGLLLYQTGDLESARTSFERAAAEATSSDLSPAERSTIQDNLGRAYRDQGELDLARQAFRRAVVFDPSNASAHNNLGNVLYRQGECEDAEFELAQAVALAPNSLSPISQLAIALFECDKVDESVSRFEQAVAMDNAILLPGIFTYLARAYLEQGRVDDAVRRAQQGALLSEGSAEAYYWLGRAYLARNGDSDAEAARRALERALEIDPNYGDAQEALNGLP